MHLLPSTSRLHRKSEWIRCVALAIVLTWAWALHAQTAPPEVHTQSIRFEDILAHSRIQFTLKNSLSPQRYSIETMLGGVALFDYDNDGLLDIFFVNGAAIPSLSKSNPSYSNRLFHNNGDGTFTDVTEKAGLAGIGYSMGAAAA
ncbi:MAG TPA: VCBS repeat-containing protein, partial [Terracidiphilus sp.]|nr:VCBS repeat-containing protein [Terracidiphilus sp.]